MIYSDGVYLALNISTFQHLSYCYLHVRPALNVKLKLRRSLSEAFFEVLLLKGRIVSELSELSD